MNKQFILHHRHPDNQPIRVAIIFIPEITLVVGGKWLWLLSCRQIYYVSWMQPNDHRFFSFSDQPSQRFFFCFSIRHLFPISDVVVYFISTLELRLRQQEFVELVRSSKRMDAVNHARKYFSVVDVEHMPKVQQLMGLLAFTEDTKVSPYMVRLCTHSIHCGTNISTSYHSSKDKKDNLYHSNILSLK